jgi:hypothetical protein
MKRVILLLSAVLLFATAAFAQVRPVEKPVEEKTTKIVVPESVPVRYEGGLFGYSEKEEGTLKFDDINERLVFYGKEGKEKFSMPYGSMLIIYPQSKSVTTTAGSVVKMLPLPGAMLGGLIKEKRRYLIVHFDDPDVDAKGVINFKLETKEVLDAVIDAIVDKADLVQRGDAYYRPRSK